jgi:hypothetical protein
MGQIKWYKRDPQEALAAMQSLSLQERGAYTTLLEVWRLQGFRLTDDDRLSARILNVDIRVWKRIKRSLFDLGFITCGCGTISPAHTFESRLERQAIPLAVRSAIIARDGNCCRYCGDQSGPFEFDHVLPWSRGGQDTEANLVRACMTCNRAKGDRTPDEMGWEL